MKDKHILDSSIWIEIHRKNPEILTLVAPLLEKSQVCLVDVIAVEVLRGVRSQRDFLRLKKAFADFVQLSVSWMDVASLAFRVQRRGYAPPLVDLYIAQCAIQHKKILITQDKHFCQIAEVQSFALEWIH